jgi:hypothetical protein
MTPDLQNNQSKVDWRYGSSGGVPALQMKLWVQILVPPRKKKERSGIYYSRNNKGDLDKSEYIKMLNSYT